VDFIDPFLVYFHNSEKLMLIGLQITVTMF